MKTSWDEITVEDYKQIQKIDANPNLTEEEKKIEKAAYLSNRTVEEIANLSYAEAPEIFLPLDFLDNFYPEFEKRKRDINEIVLNNTKYLVKTDLQKYTYSQFVTFEECSKKNDNVGILSTLLIPATATKYADGYDVEQVKKNINDYMLFIDSQVILFFFAKKLINSINSMQKSLSQTIMKEMKKKKRKEKKNKILHLFGLA